MGMKISPQEAVNYARRRLANWQVLYEPGQEKSLEGRYAEQVTAVPTMSDTSLGANSKSAKPEYAEPTEEMKKKRTPPTHFVIQYIDDCLVITASYASHIRALKRFLIASQAEKMWINTKAVFATTCVSFVGFAVSYD